MIGLDQLGTVYTVDELTGDFTVVDKVNLCCRLAVVTVAGVDPGPGRVELLEERRLLWEPDYTMPEIAQVEVDGKRWNVQEGTLASVRGPSGSVHYHRARVIEAG